MRRGLLCLLLAAVGALCLASCGGGSDSSTQAETQPESTAKSHFEGGEKSIEDFGEEATGSERDDVLGVEQAYLNGLAEKDYGAACSYLAGSVQRSLQQLVAQQSDLKGCAAILPKLLAPSAPAIAREQANGRVTKVRVEDDRAFVVFHAPGAKLYVFPMAHEDDTWKATTVAASILVPSAATLGTG